MTNATVQQNLVQATSLMGMRLAYYKSVAEGNVIDAFVASPQDYYNIKCEKDARIAFSINARGEETIFGVPFKLMRD